MSSLTLKQETLAVRRAAYREAAKRYAAANASDPFALARSNTHIAMGLCDPDFDKPGTSRDGFYNALRTINPDTGRVSWTQIKRL